MICSGNPDIKIEPSICTAGTISLNGRSTGRSRRINHTIRRKEMIYFSGITMYVGWFMVLNATFNNISDILWRSFLLVAETGVPEENHRPAVSH